VKALAEPVGRRASLAFPLIRQWTLKDAGVLSPMSPVPKGVRLISFPPVTSLQP